MQKTFPLNIEKILGENLQSLTSSSLRLEKFMFLSKNDKSSKKQQLDEVCRLATRKELIISKIKGDFEFSLELAGRMMVNHAGGILENAGICFHRFFNYPIIPGSAVKGIARHYAWILWKRAVNDCNKSDSLLIAENISRIFGFPTGNNDLDEYITKEIGIIGDHAGTIAFLPALPSDDTWQIVTDILNPHGGNDYTNPVPSFFIAVEKGSKFDFVLKKTTRGDGKDLKIAADYLKQGLIQNGAGAKTVAGYGCFIEHGSARKDSIELTLATPGFLGGASLEKQDDTDLRVSSLRGMLRWWWKVLYRGLLNIKDLEDLENFIWGNTSESSMIVLRLTTTQKQVCLYDYKNEFRVKDTFANVHNIDAGKTGLFYLSYGMDEISHNEKRQRYYIEPGAKWGLNIDVRNRLSQYTFNGKTVTLEAIKSQAVIALSLLCRFGGVGSKSRKGFGSLYWKGALSLEECKENAKVFCGELGIATSENYEKDYSLNSAVMSELTLPVSDPWTAIDRLGLIVRDFAAQYKHKSEKAVLGLPRQIHGPRKEPMRHQTGKAHQPPLLLMPDLRAAQNGTKTRFASPICYHFEPNADGQLYLRITAFPSNLIKNDRSISETIFSDLIRNIEHELPVAFAMKVQNIPAPINRFSGNKNFQNNNINKVSGIKAGDKVQAKLLEEKTKKGGWLAENNLLGKGSIQNTGDVPTDKKPGDEVELSVAIAKQGAAQYKWPK